MRRRSVRIAFLRPLLKTCIDGAMQTMQSIGVVSTYSGIASIVYHDSLFILECRRTTINRQGRK
ncbi:MAG: hypothetical protein IPG82_19700 [Saprospiraceae bacterium]|nr:hypothetical protein [Saprospiraceae bacterium]